MAGNAVIDRVTSGASRRFHCGVLAVVELSPSDRVINGSHHLMALVANLAGGARKNGVAAGAPSWIALGIWAMVSPERDRVVEGTLRGW